MRKGLEKEITLFTVLKNNFLWDKVEKGVFVVAEIGKNFIQSQEKKESEEYLKNAQELVRLAKETGADAVKFQTHNLEDEQVNVEVIAPHFSGSDRYTWVKRNEKATPMEFWMELKKYCEDLGIVFFSTPMSRGAAVKLEKVGTPLWKVGSGDILDFVMLDFLAATKKPILLSSGMSTLEEVDKAMEFLKKRNCRAALLHCVSKYPCPPEELNLQTIKFFQDRYDVPIGFSDHSVGFKEALAAVAMGATIIEKHFSKSRDLWGSDHKVSLTPEEFQKMVKSIRRGESAPLEDYGKEDKLLSSGEAVFRPIFRKSLVAGQDIKKGTVFGKKMIYAMRPQGYLKGLPSEEYEQVLSKTAARDIKKYEPIGEQDYE
jgi:N,N'-diacetyllegionaminate synthase